MHYDFHVTFDESAAPIEYDYLIKTELVGPTFRPTRDDARGTDALGFTSNFLDLTPLGRQEDWKEPKGSATALGEHLESAVRLSLARRLGRLARRADWIEVDGPPMTDEAWLSAFHAAWLEVDRLGCSV